MQVKVKEIIIDGGLFVSLMNYLGNKPYLEVKELIIGLERSKPILPEEEKVEDTEEKEEETT